MISNNILKIIIILKFFCSRSGKIIKNISFSKSSTRVLFFSICQLPIGNVLAYTDRSLASYFTENIIWRLLMSGGYYSLGSILIIIIAGLIFKSFRAIITSFFIAFFALCLLILIFEVIEEMAWLPPM